MISRAVLADSGPLYAISDPSDQFHQRASNDMSRLAGDRLETEASAVLVNPQTSDYLTAFRLIERYQDQTITITDAVLAVVSQRTGLPVWTYDHDFDLMQVAVWREL